MSMDLDRYNKEVDKYNQDQAQLSANYQQPQVLNSRVAYENYGNNVRDRITSGNINNVTITSMDSNKAVLTVEPVKKEKGWKGYKQKLSKQKSDYESKQARGQLRFSDYAKDFGAGLIGSTVVPVVDLVTTNPKETAKGMYYTATHPKEVGEEIGKTIRDRPSYTLGAVGGQILLFKGGTVVKSGKNVYIKAGNKKIKVDELS